MTLHLKLPAAVEVALRRQAAAAGKDVETFVADVVAERLAEAESLKGSSPEGFEKRLQEWIDLHPRTGRAVDDSRESIYAGWE